MRFILLRDSWRYRPDIDGLRAISVLCVIFYHFQIFSKYSKNGFIGVDIFFVISGYLITKLLVHEINSKNWIREFYFRRIRRIIPSLLVILTASLFLGTLLMLPYEFKNFGREIVGGSTFTSNLVYLQLSGYFDSSATQKPLLHLWSLGIEEQFYIFWPLFIWGIKKLKLNLNLTLALFSAISFTYCQVISESNRDLSFYSPAARAWELSLGGLLAGMQLVNFVKPIKMIGNLGFFILISFFLVLNQKANWPSYFTAIPVFATLAILSDSSSRSIKNRILTSKILVYLGKISYPLYLWHWPAFVFFSMYIGTSLNKKNKLILLLITVLLSIFSYEAIEKPIKQLNNWKFVTKILFFPMTCLLICGIILNFSTGFPSRLNDKVSLNMSREISFQLKAPQFQDSICNAGFPNRKSINYSWWFCRANSSKPPVILLWGNSFANQYFEGLSKNNYFKNTSILSIGDCAIQRQLNLPAGNPCKDRNWDDQNEFVKNIVRNTDSLKYVILAGLKENASDSDISDLKLSIRFLEDNGIKPILFYPHLQPKKPIYSCIDRPFATAKWNCKDPLSVRESLNANFSQTLRAINADFPSIRVFDPNVIFCNSTECTYKIEGIPLLRDAAPHMSIAASDLVAKQFEVWFKNKSMSLN